MKQTTGHSPRRTVSAKKQPARRATPSRRFSPAAVAAFNRLDVTRQTSILGILAALADVPDAKQLALCSTKEQQEEYKRRRAHIRQLMREPSPPPPAHMPWAPSIETRLKAIQRAAVLAGAAMTAIAEHDDSFDAADYAKAAAERIQIISGEAYWLTLLPAGVLNTDAPDDDQADAIKNAEGAK